MGTGAGHTTTAIEPIPGSAAYDNTSNLLYGVLTDASMTLSGNTSMVDQSYVFVGGLATKMKQSK